MSDGMKDSHRYRDFPSCAAYVLPILRKKARAPTHRNPKASCPPSFALSRFPLMLLPPSFSLIHALSFALVASLFLSFLSSFPCPHSSLIPLSCSLRSFLDLSVPSFLPTYLLSFFWISLYPPELVPTHPSALYHKNDQCMNIQT
jgi:hypothetical protein